MSISADVFGAGIGKELLDRAVAGMRNQGFLQATLWAMRQAVMSLTVKPDHVLIDGNIVPKELPCGGEAVIGGDGRSVSIAAASIIAYSPDTE